jgi:hypothetical protein
MKLKAVLSFFWGILICLLLSFTSKQNEVADQVFLDIAAHHDQIPLFNYTTKMAAVDTRPYNPNDPKVFPPTTLFKSRSTDTTTHGGKIFRLRAQKDAEYAYDLKQPEGQVLHMATFYYEQSKTTLGDGKSLRLSDSLYLNPTTRSNFYLMLKTNSKDYPTDNGWVYAVVSPDGQKVLQKGLITSCMGCHGASKVDRMLGAK